MRPPVLAGRDARYQQRSGQVVDDLPAVYRGFDRRLVGYVADEDFRAQVRQWLRLGA